jgi:hypothetical protein
MPRRRETYKDPDLPPERPRPLKTPGERNWECPHYQKCLDRAVEREWSAFSCSEHCAFRHIRQPSAIQTEFLLWLASLGQKIE